MASLHGLINKNVDDGTSNAAERAPADPKQKVGSLKIRIKIGGMDLSAINYASAGAGLNQDDISSSPSSSEYSTSAETDTATSSLSDTSSRRPEASTIDQRKLISEDHDAASVEKVVKASAPPEALMPLGTKTMKNKRKNAGVASLEPGKKPKRQGAAQDDRRQAQGHDLGGAAARKEGLNVSAQKGAVKARESDTEKPVKKASTAQSATVVVKEATNLKHAADRLKAASVPKRDSTELYLQAALKFLHGAYLYEACIEDRAIPIYRSTAKFCEFCAHEYERIADTGGASLAYKCMEVAYTRVARVLQSRDRDKTGTEVRTTNPHPCPHEALKCLAEKLSAPQTNEHAVYKLLQDRDSISAKVASSKQSHKAFAATKLGKDRTKHGDSIISSIRKARDFSVNDNVEGFIHSVRVALEELGDHHQRKTKKQRLR